MKKVWKKIFASLLIAAMLIPNAFALTIEYIDPGKSFSDEIIKAETVSSWAEKEVTAAELSGLVPNMTDLPGYQDTITREQFAELVVRLVTVVLGEAPKPDASLSFTDCSNPSVMLAASAGIVNGVGNDLFAPKSYTNREQIAVMLHRAIAYISARNGINVIPEPASIYDFTDKHNVSSWAREGVGALAANGIMKGTSKVTLSPKDSCTVEQSILLVYRLYQSYQGQ